MPSPPFRVYGHPRSGNHVLAALLQRSMFPKMRPIDITNANTGHWSQRKQRANYCIEGVAQRSRVIAMPYGRILGNHNFPSRVPGTSHTVYVIRDGRDMAISFWRWKKFRPIDQEDVSLELFLRTPIDWKESPGYRQTAKKRYVLFDHWRDHVDAWIKSSALCVRYEEVVRDPGHVVEEVASRFDLPIRGTVDLPKAVGWNPSGGAPRVGTWRTELPDDSKQLFEKKVPIEHAGRWEKC